MMAKLYCLCGRQVPPVNLSIWKQETGLKGSALKPLFLLQDFNFTLQENLSKTGFYSSTLLSKTSTFTQASLSLARLLTELSFSFSLSVSVHCKGAYYNGHGETEIPLPPGFGFRPTEEEIFSNYLTRKVYGEFDFDFIPEFDVYKHEPSEISSIFPGPKSDTLWHFFPTREKKAYKASRSTKAGYWKSDRTVRCWQGDKHEGMRTTFVFYIGRRVGNNMGKRTAWIMHEYFMQEKECKGIPQHKKDHIVLCRVTKRVKECLTDADTSAPAEEGSTPVPNPEQKNFSSSKGTEDEDSCSSYR